ncbi:MAG: PIG-L family deacetylase [Flavobacteriales bacterium]|nr:PIG-L family deacetylase [Flavobacteriales bacterium]
MRKIGLLTLMIACLTMVFAQKPHQANSSEIYQKIKKLNVLGNVLYLAAHPDDENTRFIAYCANEKLMNTAYLSLTRGDGGQNLIGPEIREELGIIRTQELLAARRTDGGQQFFTRANDFGYSKTPEETLEIWDKDKILSDVVWIIRKFKPDVIVCRFPTDGKGGHGHHTSSALLGQEAFKIAADPTVYPEQLQFVEPWQAKRIVVNTGRWWNDKISADDSGVVAEDIGLYNPELGISYNELAAKSRTMHKSQGFGSTGTRGEQLEFFEHLEGKEAENSLFDDVDFTWKRAEGGEKIEALIQTIIQSYEVAHPEKSITKLVELKKAVLNLKDEFWRVKKKNEIDALIKDCAGLYLEAKTDDYWATNGDSVKVNFELIARNFEGMKLKRIVVHQNNQLEELDLLLKLNHENELKRTYFINDFDESQPYWLKEQGTLGTYKVDEQLLIGTPENFPALSFSVDVEINGWELNYAVPLVYKWNDPVKGEQYRPFEVVPPVFVNFMEETQLFSNLSERKIEMVVKAATNNVNAVLSLNAPKGWELTQNTFKVGLKNKGDEQKIETILKPSSEAMNGELTVTVKVNKRECNQSLKTITYDHIPTQIYMPKAKVQLVYIDLIKKGEKIGYINGAGDVIPEALRNVGYEVTELSENDLDNLKQFDAIVLGIRALNTNDRIDFYMPKLLAYCKNGGNLILQYNTSHRVNTENFAPYPLKLSRDRVTEEDAAVSFLKPEHPVLNTPNKITQKDFESWVQERGLYFPNEWDEQYDAILSWHDKGEEAKNGSLLVAKYGEGYYVYTGISFFRELPAGVPGAYRLLVNLISLGK